MTIVLASKPGLTGATALSIPTAWDSAWFRGFINNTLKGSDVRNAIGANGIKITGNISSPYATIGFSGPATITGPITINGVSGASYPLSIQGNLSGTSNGLTVEAGITSTDLSINVANAANTYSLLSIWGDGHGQIGHITGSGSTIAWTAAGNITISAPNSGISLAVNGSIQTNTAPSTAYAIDQTGTAQKIAVANGGGIYTLPTGSGLLIVYDDGGNGGCYAYLIYGSVVLTTLSGALFTTTSGHAGTVNIYYNGTNYVIQNNFSSNVNLWVSSFRVRPSN